MKMYKTHLFAHVVRVVALSASAPFMIHPGTAGCSVAGINALSRGWRLPKLFCPPSHCFYWNTASNNRIFPLQLWWCFVFFHSSVELTMVQLSPSPTLDITFPPEKSKGREEDSVTDGILKMGSPAGLNTLQLNMEISTAYYGYETYIEDGLICLKHKIRNLEKKKVSFWQCCKSGRLLFVTRVVPTAETARLQEETEAGWGSKQRSNGESS